MKKLLIVLFTLLMIICLSLSIVATEVDESADTSTNVATEDENAGVIIEETTDNIKTLLVGGGIGGGVILFITIIGFMVKNSQKVKGFFGGMKEMLMTVFSPDGKNVSNVANQLNDLKGQLCDIGTEFNKELTTNAEKYDELKEIIDKQNHIISAFIMNSNLVHPYAKNELMKLVCGDKECGCTVEETVNGVRNAVNMAKEQEAKPETPYLDKVIDKANEEV